MSQAAVSSLRKSGVGVIDTVVNLDQRLVSEVLGTAVCQGIPTDLPKPTTRRTRQQQGPRGNDGWRMSAAGRFHRRSETFVESDLETFAQVESRIWPLVAAFFQDGDANGTQGIYCSELQARVLTKLQGNIIPA